MKKEQIIEAARKLFNKFGFKKVSMDEIAREAGVTKRTVYMYFSSKEELFNYFIQEELNNMKKIVEDIEKQNLNFFEAIHQIIYNLIKYKHNRKFLKITAFLIYKMYIALMFDWNENNKKLDEKSIADNILKIAKNGLQKGGCNE